MSWYYVQKGVLGDETIGPVDAAEFLEQVRGGKHKAKAVVASQEITGGNWVELQTVPVLRAAIIDGQKRREEKRAEEQRQRESDAELKRAETEYIAKQRAEREREESVRRHAASDQQQKHEAAQRLRDETTQVFDRYWMPAYLKSLWIVAMVVHAVAMAVVGLALLLSFGGANPDVARIFILFVTLMVIIADLVWIRLLLEAFAIVFDIRGLLKSQLVLMNGHVTK